LSTVEQLPLVSVGRAQHAGDMTEIPGGLHGAYTYQQARAALGDYGLRSAVDRGRLVGFGRGVLLAEGRQHDVRTRAAAATLLAGPDSVLVHSTAAVLHGYSAISGYTVHIRVPYRRRVRSRAGMIVHQGPIDESEIVCRDGLRMLRRAPLLAELLRTASRRGALACADEILRGFPERARADFRDEVAQLLAANPNQRGTRQAIDLLSLATGLPESPAQSAALLIMVEAGLPTPRCQYPVHDSAGQFLRSLDFAWPEERIALDYDGDHGRADDDLIRDADLRSRGWQVFRAQAEDLRDPTALSIRLREVFADRQLAA
jgi:hypothetical protein